jgi:hypothetical protein
MPLFGVDRWSALYLLSCRPFSLLSLLARLPTRNQNCSVKEGIAFCDTMAMLLLGFGYLMTFLKKYGMGASCFHHDVVFLNMELNIVVEFYVRLLYSEKG